VIIDLEELKKEVTQVSVQSGEGYVSLHLEVNHFEGLPDSWEWSCYTARTGHSKRHRTPEAALAETRSRLIDPDRIQAAAKALEAEAMRLRAIVARQAAPTDGGAK